MRQSTSRRSPYRGSPVRSPNSRSPLSRPNPPPDLFSYDHNPGDGARVLEVPLIPGHGSALDVDPSTQFEVHHALRAKQAAEMAEDPFADLRPAGYVHQSSPLLAVPQQQGFFTPDPYRQQQQQQMAPQQYSQPIAAAEEQPVQVKPPKKEKTREVYSYKEVAPTERQRIPDQRALHSVIAARGLAAVDCLTIFSAVTTMMVVATTVRSEIDAGTLEEVGDSRVDMLTNAVAYGSLPFFWLIVLRINNHFSERMYYKYLQRGMILDFPLSDYSTYLKKIEAMVFLVYFVVYGFFSLIALWIVNVRVGNLIIFLTNLGTGVFLEWYNNQTIELEAISLTRYIESFPDADNEYDNIDARSLNAAAVAMTHMTLIETQKPSYTGAMRKSYQEMKLKEGLPAGEWKHWDTVVNVGMYVGIVFISVLGIIYVIYQGDVKTTEVWESLLNPCVTACIRSSTLSAYDPTRCGLCVCQCTKMMGYESRLLECPFNLNLKFDPQVCDRASCPTFCL